MNPSLCRTWMMALSLGVALVAPSVRAQPVDERIGTAAEYVDPEFKGLAVVYQDGNRQVWRAQVDPLTGTVLPTGRQLIDTQATSIYSSFQGPEWLRGTDRVLYTKTPAATATLWISGPTQITFAPVDRYLLSGIATWRGTAKVVYRRVESTASGTVKSVNWLDTALPGVEHAIPGTDLGVSPLTWIPDTEDLLYCRTGGAGGLTQLARYSTALRTPYWLTADSGNKVDAFAFYAPERGNALLYAAVVDDTTLRIYQDLNGSGVLGDAPGEAKDLRPRTASPDMRYIFSPEPFKARDSQGTLRTYFSLILRNYLGSPGTSGRGEVWVWGLDDDFELKADSSSAANPRQPGDPETAAGQSEIFLYYSTPSTELWRIRTGLAPP